MNQGFVYGAIQVTLITSEGKQKDLEQRKWYNGILSIIEFIHPLIHFEYGLKIKLHVTLTGLLLTPNSPLLNPHFLWSIKKISI